MVQRDPSDRRWVQRFENYSRAFVRLREAVERLEANELDDLQREGLIQRFEVAWELAWKTLKDFLDYKKVTLDRISPGEVIKTAFACNYIKDGQDWMDALDARNLMSHVYRQQAFEQTLIDVERRFVPCLEALHELLISERAALDD